MQTNYNLYHLRKRKFDDLLEKMNAVGLNEQKHLIQDGYLFTFYFSSEIEGNDIWWYKTYQNFFNDGLNEPQNLFYYALMVISSTTDKENKYLISLGKSHFYLNKFIEKDFGINVAMRIADEESMLLKKSRIFGGGKRQEITSYIEFKKDNYESGESVEHLKLKAVDTDLWGEKNIIFADSIQFNLERSPIEIIPIITLIEEKLKDASIISLPKLEIIKDEDIIKTLDLCLKDEIKSMDQNIKIEEFTTYGVEFCFNFLNYDYKLYYFDESTKRSRETKDLGSTISMSDIKEIVDKLDEDLLIDNIKIQFSIDGKGKYTKNIKEVLDCHIGHSDGHYFLRDGLWYCFNYRFMEILKKSIESIELIKGEDFDESEYQKWKLDKEEKIAKGHPVENNITYREYYFNLEKSKISGYILMDREQTLINSLKIDGRKYSLEIADLYKDKTIFSVKIGKKKESMIYNIEQSKDSIELINKKVIETDKEIEKCGLWFILDEDIENIFDINSIQFLLAIESWKRKVIACEYTPVIKITKRVNI